MKNIFIHSFIKVRIRNILIIGSLLILTLGISGTGSAGEDISVSLDASGISATAMIADASSIVIRVAGPQDFFAEERSATGFVYWSLPGGLPDGLYRYEVYVLVGGTSEGEDQDDDSSHLYREKGRFNIEWGQLFAPDESEESETLGFWQGAKQTLARLVGTVLDGLVPAAHAADLTASSSIPTVYYDDTDDAGIDWSTAAYDAGTSNASWRLSDRKNNFNYVFTAYSSANNARSFVVDTSGDISMANGAAFIDRSNTQVGLGTTTPAAELHILKNTAAIRLDDGGTGIWEITENANDLRFNDIASKVSNVMVLDGNTQNVGLGTSAPNAKLHITGADAHNSFQAKIMGHTGGTSHTQFITDLANSRLSVMASTADDYAPRLQMIGPQDGSPNKGTALFDFGSTKYDLPVAQFRIRHALTASVVDMIRVFGRDAVTFPKSNVNVGIRTNFPKRALEVTPGGAYCDGNRWVDKSSRDAKDNILELKTEEALAALKNIKPVKFNYKQDPDKETNLGFIAEDVPDLVATKDRKGMVSMEVVAVLTKVVQEQQALMTVQHKAFDEQKKIIAELTERIRHLEAK